MRFGCDIPAAGAVFCRWAAVLWMLTSATVSQAAPLVTGVFPKPYLTGPGDDLSGQLGWSGNDPADDLSFFVRWNGSLAGAVGGYFSTPTLRHADFQHGCGEPLAGITFRVDLAFINSGACEPGQTPGIDCFPGRDAFGWTFRDAGGAELMRVAFEPTPLNRMEIVWYDGSGTRISTDKDLFYGATYSLRVHFEAVGPDIVFNAAIHSGSTLSFQGTLAGKSGATLDSIGFDFDVSGATPGEAGDNMMVFNRLSVIPEPAVQAPSPSTLVVAEINCQPPPPSVAEAISPVPTASDFEFVRLLNVGSTWLDLRQLRFTGGMSFDFSKADVLLLPPGAYVTVVKRQLVFERRYGSAGIGNIAGQFSGTLNDAGQTISLEWGDPNLGPTSILHRFAYGGAPLWPAGAAGFGPTLLLKNPDLAPDPANPQHWTASAHPGGQPGGMPHPLDYDGWRALCFSIAETQNDLISGRSADPDGDGMTNELECILGSIPRLWDDATQIVSPGMFQQLGETFLALDYRLQPGITGLTLVPEVSTDLTNWNHEPADLVILSGPLSQPNGTISWKVRDAIPHQTSHRRFLRASVQ